MEQQAKDLKIEDNKSLQQVGLYMMKDKTTGVHSFMYQSQSDDLMVIQEMTRFFGGSFLELKKNQRIGFMNALHNSLICRIGYVDLLTGEMTSDYSVLADCKDIVFEEKEKK